jgi:hypothetical protein
MVPRRNNSAAESRISTCSISTNSVATCSVATRRIAVRCTAVSHIAVHPLCLRAIEIERLGGVDREIRIALDPDRLAAYGVTTGDVNR